MTKEIINSLLTENAVMLEALERIANYTPYSDGASYGGNIARQALKEGV